jgi:hypothetical protein
LLSGGHYIKREEGENWEERECVLLGVFFLLIFNFKMYSLSFVPLRGEGWSRNRCVLTWCFSQQMMCDCQVKMKRENALWKTEDITVLFVLLKKLFKNILK